MGLMGVKLMADGSAGAEDRPSLRPLIRFHSSHPQMGARDPILLQTIPCTLGHTSGDLILLKTMPYYLRPNHNKSHTLGGAIPLDGSLILSSILPGSLLALSYETSITLGTFFHKLCQRDQSSSARTIHKRATSK